MANIMYDQLFPQHIHNIETLNEEVSKMKKLPSPLKNMHAIMSLSDYLCSNNIDDVVIGISGGVDSSAVLGMLNHIKKSWNPLRRTLNIHAYCITFDCYNGVFEDRYIDLLKKSFPNVHYRDVDLSKSLHCMMDGMGTGYSIENVSQTAYALRYMALFNAAQHFGGVTIGTVNFDELTLGWFGKNSDMVVDLSILHDFQKFEVLKLAEFVGVPEEIINRVPVGDLIDGSSDEENFGVCYDHASWFAMMCANGWESISPSPFIQKHFQKLNEVRNRKNYLFERKSSKHYNPIFL